MRADYLPALQAMPGIHPRLKQSLYLLSPLTEQKRQAVVNARQRPAGSGSNQFGRPDSPRRRGRVVAAAGVHADPAVGDTARKTLSFDGYHQMGGVSGALDRFAEQQMSTLADDTVEIVERLLLRLVHTPAEDAGLTILKRAHQPDLPAAEWKAAQHLAEARLVIVDTDSDRGPYAELAHEALITSWQRLRHLLRDNTDRIGWLAWVQQRVAKGHLLPAARLAEARRWVEGPAHNIPDPVDSRETEAEARLCELSLARERAEAAAGRAEAATGRAEAAADEPRQQRDELRQRRSSRGVASCRRRRAGAALGAPSATVALALGAESVLTEPTPQGDLALRHVLRLHPRTRARMDHDGPV